MLICHYLKKPRPIQIYLTNATRDITGDTTKQLFMSQSDLINSLLTFLIKSINILLNLSFKIIKLLGKYIREIYCFQT